MTVAFPNAGPVRLRTNLADYAVTRALKAGEVRSDLVSFDFAGPKQAYEGFKPMVREQKFDAGELAIVTFLQAKAFGKPLTLLPAVAMGRSQHQCFGYNAGKGALAPKDLEGRRVGVRAYTQTTGVWLRGILAHEYGVDLDRVQFVTFEDPHVAEYRDPPSVERASGDKAIDRMLLDGDLDAAIVGELPKDARVRPLFPDPQAATRAWIEKHGTVPVNHLFVVDQGLARTRPDVVKEIYRVLLASKQAAPAGAAPADAIDFHPFGVAALRKPLDLIAQYAFEQGIVPRRFTADELFDETTASLGT